VARKIGGNERKLEGKGEKSTERKRKEKGVIKIETVKNILNNK